MSRTQTLQLRSALSLALQGTLAKGWLYLPEVEALRLDTPCLLVSDAELDLDASDVNVPAIASDSGFPVEGLDSQTLAAVTSWCRQFEAGPSKELLLESFIYYWKWDAFLPEAGAPDPPSPEDSRLLQDRAFYDRLGPETPDTPCKRPECERGAIPLSSFCKAHHFESVMKRPCPFGTPAP